MQFQIFKLIIWPKSPEFPPQVIPFELGKVNVITGSSRTGKSAIIPIIDYCLASSDCFIPIDTIRDFVSWYGVVIHTEAEQILIARKVPLGNKVSNEFYLSRGRIVSIPPIIEEPNEKTEGVKHILNAIASVPYFNLSGSEDEKENYQARLSFRDLMALIFQNQDIVANQNILFYKTHAHEHRERLRNWFPFILGIENIEILVARQRLQFVEKRLGQLKKEFEKIRNVSASWMANMLGHIKIAQEYGILNQEISDDTPSDELLLIAKRIFEDIPKHSNTKIENIESANKEIIQLEIEERNISEQIAEAKKRLNDVKRLRTNLIDYGNSQQKRADRLHISMWLENVSSESVACPACGSSEHPKSTSELSKVISAFKKYEDQSRNVAEVPTSFSREEERTKLELQKLLDHKEKIQKRFDLLISRDKKAQEEFQRNQQMFIFLGHLKASIETFEKLVDGGDLQKEITSLEMEYSDLQVKVDKGKMQLRIEKATTTISQKMLNHLKTLDVEEKYRRVAPRFIIKDLNISILSNDGNWHYLAQVGSASNWVSFHIALMCSLQEFFLEMENSCVPSFVIFDQPSQVYFPKLKRINEDTEDEPQYDNEDITAVKSIFSTIANSVVASQGAWQCIILDHADGDIYGTIEGVHEVVEWRNGKKLIPEEWYS
ncbi:DUF3732 domain-containing protein [Paenibacillus sp. UASWS1643]|uniref:DUF3732 domain-containing protein n=1 Tax=Paenibacillus sp. UASWS1643 TaxID=2580422 RepID=UPI00123B3CD8|nr:DUF3732 domain-containing protein [Paenibacillus sp. UASWS1643]KAA8750038.1 DUF3732 domain-containing protein [Paenibacillus sp. UASWS1643]